MAGIPTHIDGVVLTDTAAALHVVPATKRLILKQVSLCNLDALARTVSLHNAAPAAGAGIDNAVVYQASLSPGETIMLPMSMVVGPGGQLLASADIGGFVVCAASGVTYDDDDQPQPRLLHRGLLSAAPLLAYDSPVDEITVLKHMTVCNVTISDRWFSLYVVPDGQALADEHLVVHERSVPPRSTLFEALSVVLSGGDSVYFEASNDAMLAATISGVAA